MILQTGRFVKEGLREVEKAGHMDDTGRRATLAMVSVVLSSIGQWSVAEPGALLDDEIAAIGVGVAAACKSALADEKKKKKAKREAALFLESEEEETVVVRRSSKRARSTPEDKEEELVGKGKEKEKEKEKE